MKYPNLDWGTMEAVVNKLGGEDGVKSFLSGLSRVVSSSIISINRHVGYQDHFLPTGLWTEVDSDQRSKRLSVIDLREVRLVPRPLNGSFNLTGEEKLQLIRQSEEVCLDARILEIAFRDPRIIPETWKNKVVYFDGSVFLTPASHIRTVLCLSGDEHGWRYSPEPLTRINDTEGWSAVL